MSVDDLRLPEKGFTKAERAWIKNVLIPALKTVHAVPGRNITITDDPNKGQTINSQDCAPCS